MSTPSASGPRAGGRTGRWRPLLVGVLVLLLAVLTPLGLVARWAHDQVTDTDHYVATVAPLAEDPAIRTAVTDRITTELLTRLQVEAVTDEAVDALADLGLPPLATTGLSALGGPLADAVEGFVRDQVEQLVSSEEFAIAWEEANRQAHTQLVAVLTGQDTDLVEVSDHAVTVDLATVVEAVRLRLLDRGFELAARLPAVSAEFTILESDDLPQAQGALRLLSAASTLLPVLVLALLALVLTVARRRRRALVAAMLAVAASLLLLGVGLNAARAAYLDSLPPDVSTAAAAVVYDTLVASIRLGLRALLVVVLAVAALAWASGPSTPAVALRRGAGRALGRVRGDQGPATGRLGVLLGAYRPVIRVGVLGLALLVYVMTDHPTGRLTLGLVLGAGLVLLLVELLARPEPTGGDQRG